MNVEVPETVRQKANRCRNNFACIATGGCGGQSKCETDYLGGENVLILAASEEQFSCPYRIYFGGRWICSCPVNYYLYATAPHKAG